MVGFGLFLHTLVILLSIFVKTECRNAMQKTRYFKLEQYSLCSNESELVDITDFKITFNDNIFKVNGDMSVKKDLSEHLQLELIVDRCQINRAQCENFDLIVIKDLCEKLVSSSVGAEFSNRIKPPLACPIKTGTYHLTEGTIDLNMIAHLPLDGFRWAVWIKIWDMSERPKKTLVTCLEGQVRVMLNSRRRT